jgi:hypothetical protein
LVTHSACSGELGQHDANLLQMGSSDLLIQLLRQHVDTDLAKKTKRKKEKN